MYFFGLRKFVVTNTRAILHCFVLTHACPDSSGDPLGARRRQQKRRYHGCGCPLHASRHAAVFITASHRWQRRCGPKAVRSRQFDRSEWCYWKDDTRDFRRCAFLTVHVQRVHWSWGLNTPTIHWVGRRSIDIVLRQGNTTEGRLFGIS